LLSSSPPEITADDLTSALRRYFGFDHFRSGQEEIVRKAVEGRDTLALMPTGSGKSLCFQLAAMLRPSPTLVLSPLIALMKDQVDNLPPEIAGQACLLNSSLEPAEAARRLAAMATGKYKLMYAAPERLRQRNFVSALKSIGIGLVVIDEVHCVSMWGHDFRPDYMFIRKALEGLDDPVILGMTATATRVTESDIAASLGRQFDVVRTGVVRPNLRYEVEHVGSTDERLRSALSRAQETAGSGIVYARSRQKCEQIAALLRRSRVNALHYHAGLTPDERKRVQESFLQGRTRVIVATTAFGMGIDKADIRWVLLFDYPSSIEDYVQRIGRAGRDELPSTCTLLAGTADGASLLRFARSDLPTVDNLRAVYRELRTRVDDGYVEITAEELGRAAGLPETTDARVLVGMLDRAELVRRDYDAGRAMRVEVVQPPADAPGRIDALLRAYTSGAEIRAQRMISFAELGRCRHLQVAEHFGETVKTPCGMCDVCAPHSSSASAAPTQARPLPDNIAEWILDVVESLRWPLGRTGLAKTLKGSVDAPPSAQANQGYGSLSTVRQATIDRWIEGLIASGHLVQYPAPDGAQFSLLRVGRRDDLPDFVAPHPSPGSSVNRSAGGKRGSDRGSSDPELSEADRALFEELRIWRRATAQEKKVSPFIVLYDVVLREIVAHRPSSRRELERIEGMHPAKIEQYADDILALVQHADPPGTVLGQKA
jgi:ATP-dependent DNA helicase RecQ